MDLLALYFIVVALVWIGTKVDKLATSVGALVEAVRQSKQS